MTTNYGKYVATRNTQTPQTQPIPGSNQVKNSAGGFSFAVDCWKQLDRFTILGAEGGSYYATERKLTVDNAKNVIKCIKEDGLRVVRQMVEISDAGRAPKNDPALFVLALAASLGSVEVRQAALAALPKVARIPTHLFHFVNFVESQRGWGRALKRAIAKWYLDKKSSDLAYHAVKYQSRDGWSNRDLIRLSHPKTDDATKNTIFHWMLKGWEEVGELPHPNKDLQVIWAFEKAKKASIKELIELVTKYSLPLEAVPTDKRAPEVWKALLPSMGITALFRNLGNLTNAGVIARGKWDTLTPIIERLTDADQLKKGRIHPIQVLAALTTYSQGHGTRGSNSWDVVPDIKEALDKAFYLSFGSIVPSNMRFLLGLDISGSMGMGNVSGVPGLTPRVASAAMSMITYRTEPKTTVMGFGHEFVPINITRNDSLETVVNKISGLPFGGTDCSLPMTWALKRNIEVDTFVIYTDNETWFDSGNGHPVQALQRYRQKMGIPSKMIVVSMVANPFSIADPNDAGMLDVVGFDTSTPEIMRAFSANEF